MDLQILSALGWLAEDESRIDRLTAKMFGDTAKSHRWPRKPKRLLRGEAPLAYLATEAHPRVACGALSPRLAAVRTKDGQ
ncbi:DUF2384 domain-containing protein [Bradyrhizobium sp. CSA207]|uniref:antitoxin Xre/MbcA/ParS toxin-binding domain-containing protein n=1 Tax=Bradyrhizobium sp. CSA207 TaxID=2698826 RepID=UPI0023AEAFE8|nr:antitoxin Xre/MbcA/ParS toxin-binding domain-containing protein [Bradyrhizobium sp. CSA207]MDE5446525.1 DUF2384 domain-containing protein [Bradyrhizobium sp. CSA207]